MRILTLLMLVCLMVSPFQISAAEDADTARVIVENPGADLWRNVRQRDLVIEGTSQVKSIDANVLINISGETWRQYRTMSLIPMAGAAIMLAFLGVVLFRILRGNIKIANGRSGIKVLRFTLNQRVAHWTTAILFVLLALTGLILLFGRKFLIPVFGADGFGGLAIFAKTLHDYLGPAFMISLTVLFVFFVRDNMLSPKLDLQWILNGGGLFGKHVSSDRFNAGEKGWFWIAALVGLAIIISGMVLDFPIFGQTRATMEFYLTVHSIAAVIIIVASFGHIYMGTAALEGTFEVMKTGYCDSNWAKEHHDIWYEKVKQDAESTADENHQQPPAESTKEATT